MVKYYNKNSWLYDLGVDGFIGSGLVSFGIIPGIAIVHDILFIPFPKYVTYNKEDERLPENIDDLLCKYLEKNEQCKSLKDVCKQYPEICRNIHKNSECYEYFDDDDYECEFAYDNKGCENCSF